MHEHHFFFFYIYCHNSWMILDLIHAQTSYHNFFKMHWKSLHIFFKMHWKSLHINLFLLKNNYTVHGK
jgi:hypothetical protein